MPSEGSTTALVRPVTPDDDGRGVLAAAEADRCRMIDTDEARALVRYVARHGIEPDAAISGPLATAVTELEACTDPAERIVKTREVIELYSRLTALTHPGHGVNGRTVLDSEALSMARSTWWRFNIRPVFAKSLIWLVVFFALAVLTEAMRVYYAGSPTAGGSVGWIQKLLDTAWVQDLYRLVLLYMQPFFWGAVGASVYLLKHTGDLVAQRKFERQRQQGVATRVLLGGVFGAVIVHLFFGRVPGTDGTIADLGPSAVAFLSGLGIRAIYAGFEKVVDTLTDWISGLGKPKPPQGQGGG